MDFSHSGFDHFGLSALRRARQGLRGAHHSRRPGPHHSIAACRILLHTAQTHVHHPLPKPTPSRKIPEKIGKYVVVNEVGRGSTGIVYLSHDAYYGRDVAIKVYNMDAGGDEERARIARKMFLSEAHLVGMLQHPNILPIYDAGEENGHCYIVTEHVHGARTLAAYCRPDNLLRIDDVVEIIYKCAKALHYAHSRGVIHRDIKPSNIMLTHGQRRAHHRLRHRAGARTRTSRASKASRAARRTCRPSRCRACELTNRSDLYSLGAVMYELLTGSRPFRAGNLQKLLHQIVYATPPPIHTLRKDIPEDLENVVAMALQKDPAKRYKSGLDFAAELTRVPPEAARAELAHRPAGAVRRAAPAEVLPRVLARRDLGSAARQQLAGLRRRAKRSSRKARWTIASTSSSRATAPWSATARAVGSLDTGDCFGEASYVQGAKRTATIRAAERRDGAEGELDAARAGLGLLPAALQSGVPAHADRATAERREQPAIRST